MYHLSSENNPQNILKEPPLVNDSPYLWGHHPLKAALCMTFRQGHSVQPTYNAGLHPPP